MVPQRIVRATGRRWWVTSVNTETAWMKTASAGWRQPAPILDSKSPDTQAVLDSAPVLSDYLDAETQAEFAELLSQLDALGIAYVVNPRLVRGLDYYNKTVFEWTTEHLGAQSTVCGGGVTTRWYRRLAVKRRLQPALPWVSERLILLMQALDITVSAPADLCTCHGRRHCLPTQSAEAGCLASAVPDLDVVQHLGGGSFKSQFKRADKSGAAWALVYGDAEVANNQVRSSPCGQKPSNRP